MTETNTDLLSGLGNALVPTLIDGETRIRDLDLAARLGFADPHKIRPLIERHTDALAALGVSATVAETAGIKGGRPSRVHYLNRKQAIFITAKSDTPNATEITIEIIERFDAYEKGAALAVFNIPKSLPEALRLAADLSETVEQQKVQIALMTPKADALDRIATADGSLCVTDAAKTLQVRPKDLFQYLREHGWIYRRPGTAHDIGYQARINAGDLEHKITTVLTADGNERVTEQVRVTPKGLAKLASLLRPAVSAAA